MPLPVGSSPAPLLLEEALEDPALVHRLLKRHAPYWNQSRYQPADARAAAAVTHDGHPFAMGGGTPPLFRGVWATAETAVVGVEPLLGAPRLHQAACRLFGVDAVVPTFLYVNITAPMPGIDAGHVDVPAFRGVDRRNAPGWLLLAMKRSGLFERWAVRTATAVVWFYDGVGGELRYWPTGLDGPSQAVAPATNTAIVGDNDRMFHRVEAVGDPGRWHAVPGDALLHHVSGDRWEIRDNDISLDAYHAEELRISLSWKAAVGAGGEGADFKSDRDDNLDLERVAATLASVLRDRELWHAGAGADTIDDPAFVEAAMAAFPRISPS